MIYTVGLIDKYERQIDDQTAIKLGPHVDAQGNRYPGGWVWQTAADAHAYLVARKSTDVRRVYGVEADWEADTAIVPGEPTRCITRNARVVRLKPDHAG
jgi:hypothetical protein